MHPVYNVSTNIAPRVTGSQPLRRGLHPLVAAGALAPPRLPLIVRELNGGPSAIPASLEGMLEPFSVGGPTPGGSSAPQDPAVAARAVSESWRSCPLQAQGLETRGPQRNTRTNRCGTVSSTSRLIRNGGGESDCEGENTHGKLVTLTTSLATLKRHARVEILVVAGGCQDPKRQARCLASPDLMVGRIFRTESEIKNGHPARDGVPACIYHVMASCAVYGAAFPLELT